MNDTQDRQLSYDLSPPDRDSATTTDSNEVSHQLDDTSNHCNFSCNPHGIDTILNKHPIAAATTPPHSNALLSGKQGGGPHLPFFPHAAMAAAAAAAASASQQQQKQNQEENSASEVTGSGGGGGQQNMYWPGIQGLLTNPSFWRDRAHFTGQALVVI